MRSLFGAILLLVCWPLAAQSAAAANGADSNPVLSYVHALNTGAGAMLLRLKPAAVEDPVADVAAASAQ